VSSISVVIISKNEGSLSATLDALKAECDDVGAECIVVDASGGTLGGVRGAHTWVHWHDFRAPLDRRITIPHQRNVGVAVARGDVIAFCDAGGIPERGWLKHLTSPIVSGSARATGGPVRSRGTSAYGTLNDEPTGAALTKVITGNLAFTRELFDRIGGFDERYDYGSDSEFGWRMEDAGATVLCVSDAVMTIDWGDRRRQLRRDWHYGEAKARQLLLRPDLRSRILLESPEVLIYPVVFLTAPAAVVAAVVTRRWRLLAPWLAAVALLYARDRRCGRPRGAMLDHVVVSLGICSELVTARERTGRSRRNGTPGGAPRGPKAAASRRLGPLSGC
jgi:hypothetical protein